MPRKQSAHAQLDQLRQEAVRQRTKAREWSGRSTSVPASSRGWWGLCGEALLALWCGEAARRVRVV
jgi:hypothetical protein